MLDSLNIAATGMDAAETLLSVAANNIANLNTPNYQPESVELAAAAGGGVQVIGIDVNPAGSSNSDLSVADAIELKKAQYLYDANAAVVQAQEQMFGSLINILDTEYTQPPEQTVS
jgi:flagellar hook-associated protein FlgK